MWHRNELRRSTREARGFGRWRGVGLALALLSAWSPSPLVRADDDDRDRDRSARPTGVVYVESNDAGPMGNAIFAFRRDAAGALTPLPGSPFSAGGLGITPTFNLGPFDSDQNIIIDPTHTFLFAVNGGSDSIAVFRINSDGSLTPVDGSPFPSGGSNPVSVGLAGNILCVVNKDQDPDHPGQVLPNYTTLRVSPRGRLHPINDAAVFVDAGASPAQALVSPNGRLLFGDDFMGGLVRSFAIRADGRLMPTDAQPLPADLASATGSPALPLGMAAHPDRPLLYVGIVTNNLLGVYQYSRRGELSFLRAVPNSGKALCWVISNRDGSRLYTGNTGDNSISVYDTTADPTTPVEIQKVTLHGMANVFQIGLDPANRTLYAITQRANAMLPASANALHVLTVGGDGRLTEVASSPTVLPPGSPGTRPQGVAAL